MPIDGRQGPELLPHPSDLDDQEDCGSPGSAETSQPRESLGRSVAAGCPLRQDLEIPAGQQRQDCSKPELSQANPGQDTDKLTGDATRATSTRRAPGTAGEVTQDTGHCVCIDSLTTPRSTASQATESSDDVPTSPTAQTGGLPSYALYYQEKYGVLPWKTLAIHGYDSVPWLSLLPPEAKGSLHGWGRYMFSQTPACKRGSVSVDMYGNWASDLSAWRHHTSTADTLAKCCEAFAQSPLSFVIDIRAAMQCIGLALKVALGKEKGDVTAPSDLEKELDYVCAAGCSKGVNAEQEGPPYSYPQFGQSVNYCSYECADTHGRALPEALHIYMCWPRGWLDAAFLHDRRHTAEDKLLTMAEGRLWELRKLSAMRRQTRRRRAPLLQISTEDMRAYLQQAKKGFEAYNFSLACMCMDGLEPGPVIKAYTDIISKFKTGSLSDEDAYTALITLIYNSEHMFPEARQFLSHMLPPRPFPIVQSSRCGTVPAGPATGPSRAAAYHEKKDACSTAAASEPGSKNAGKKQKRKERKRAANLASTTAEVSTADTQRTPATPPSPFPVLKTSRPGVPHTGNTGTATQLMKPDSHSAVASKHLSPIPATPQATPRFPVGEHGSAPAFTFSATGDCAMPRVAQRKRVARTGAQASAAAPNVNLTAHPTPVPRTTPATTHAPDSPCTTVQRLTEADLARISDLARGAWADASRDKRPMLWHVRRRAYECVCAHMGLPVACVQGLLWVASERGDARGSLSALYQADPTGLCLPPELRTPYHIWICTSALTYCLCVFAMGEMAIVALIEGAVRSKLTSGEYSWLNINSLCATCGKHGDAAPDLLRCPGCRVVPLCGEECHRRHQASGACEIINWMAALEGLGGSDDAILPLSFFNLAARTASDQQAPHTSDPTPHPSSPLQRDASTTAGCPAAAAIPAPSRSVSAQRMHERVSAAQALAAEYRQCVEGNALLQRVASVVMPRGAEREPESAAVMAAQQLLIAASGLLDARDLEEVLAAAKA